MGKASRKSASGNKKSASSTGSKKTVDADTSIANINGVGASISDKDLDFSMPEKEYSGTFRWAAGKKFMELPMLSMKGVAPWEASDKGFPASEGSRVNCAKGWGPYLTSRVPDPKVIEKVKADPSVLDGLTYPVSAGCLLKSLKYPIPDEMTVVVLGAANRAEERVARETAYWGEIAICLRCRVHVVMCGPEVSEDGSLPNPNPYTKMTLFKGTFLSYQARYKPTVSDTVLITYNGGFGNFVESNRFDLLESWHDDLRAIVESEIPAFFTQANDYADLNGETALMAHIFGARFVVLPTQNPFSAASHLSEPDKPDAWACANFSFYGIQGVDPKRAMNVSVASDAGKQKLRQAVIKAVNTGCDMSSLQAMFTKLKLPVEKQPPVNLTEKINQPVKEAPHSPVKELEESTEDTKNTKLAVPKYKIETMSGGVLEVTVSLPLLSSAGDLSVEVEDNVLEISFEISCYAVLILRLPGPDVYDEDGVAAKFDKSTHELTLSLTPES